jgi:hypothetical protein
MAKILFIWAIATVLVVSAGTASRGADDPSVHQEIARIAAEATARWKKVQDDRWDGPFGHFHSSGYPSYLQDYSATGDYLNYGTYQRWDDSSEIVLRNGFPRAVIHGREYDNPVTLAQFALTMHGRLILGDTSAKTSFVAAVEKLLSMQQADGGFPYDIELEHGHLTLEPGWVSGMAQGQILSVLSRAYQVTPDARYIEAGNRALAKLLQPIEEGGTATGNRRELQSSHRRTEPAHFHMGRECNVHPPGRCIHRRHAYRHAITSTGRRARSLQLASLNRTGSIKRRAAGAVHRRDSLCQA